VTVGRDVAAGLQMGSISGPRARILSSQGIEIEAQLTGQREIRRWPVAATRRSKRRPDAGPALLPSSMTPIIIRHHRLDRKSGDDCDLAGRDQLLQPDRQAHPARQLNRPAAAIDPRRLLLRVIHGRLVPLGHRQLRQIKQHMIAE